MVSKTPIKCLIEGKILVIGFPSRTEYIFSIENNYIVDVLNEDVPDILSKKRQYRACCNSPDTNLDIFKLIE